MAQKVTQTLGRPVKEYAVDRGFYSKENEAGLEALGVRLVAIPQTGRYSVVRKKIESTFWFKRLKRWRSGEEATISLFKRKYGLDRCLFRGDDGIGAWVGISIFAHNLDKLAALMT